MLVEYRVASETHIFLYTIPMQLIKKSETVFTKIITEFTRIKIQMQCLTVLCNLNSLYNLIVLTKLYLT